MDAVDLLTLPFSSIEEERETGAYARLIVGAVETCFRAFSHE
jgi:hypothetical protein